MTPRLRDRVIDSVVVPVAAAVFLAILVAWHVATSRTPKPWEQPR